MPRLLLLFEFPTLSGGERSLLSSLPAVRNAGFDLQAVAPVEGDLAAALAGHQVEVVPWAKSAGDARPSLSARRQWLASQLRRLQPDLLHANSLAMGRLAGPVVAESGVPGVAHLRDIMRLSGQALADLNCNDRLIAVSQATREFHVAAGLDGVKTHVLYNGVDLSLFRPRAQSGDLHRELGIPPGVRLIGAVGQIILRKGLDIWIAAAQSIAEQVADVHFLLVGARYASKPETQALEAQLIAAASQPPLTGRVHLLGYRHDMPDILAELSLLLHAARQEPLGRVLLEAAAGGVAVVATNVGGAPEIFPPEANAARLVPPDDSEALAAAAVELLSNDAFRRNMGRQARRRAEEAFDVQASAGSLIEHYRALLP